MSVWKRPYNLLPGDIIIWAGYGRSNPTIILSKLRVRDSKTVLVKTLTSHGEIKTLTFYYDEHMNVWGKDIKPGMIISLTLDKTQGYKICVVLTANKERNYPTVKIIGLVDGKLVRFWLETWTEYQRYVQI